MQRSGTQRSGTPFRGTVGPARLFWAPALWLVLLLDIFLQLFFLAPWRAQLQRPHHAQPHWFERACVSKPLRLKQMFRQGSGVFTLVLPASPHDFGAQILRRRRPRGPESRPRCVLRSQLCSARLRRMLNALLFTSKTTGGTGSLFFLFVIVPSTPPSKWRQGRRRGRRQSGRKRCPH